MRRREKSEGRAGEDGPARACGRELSSASRQVAVARAAKATTHNERRACDANRFSAATEPACLRLLLLNDLLDHLLLDLLRRQRHRGWQRSLQRREEGGGGLAGVLDEDGAAGRERSATRFAQTEQATHSMMTRAAMASTIGTALRTIGSQLDDRLVGRLRATHRGTTQGSWRPRVASTPLSPSYLAVACSCEMVAGDLKAILGEASRQHTNVSRGTAHTHLK